MNGLDKLFLFGLGFLVGATITKIVMEASQVEVQYFKEIEYPYGSGRIVKMTYPEYERYARENGLVEKQEEICL